VAGWAYWAYTVFYFPGLLTASVAMSVYIAPAKYWALAKDPSYLRWSSLALLAIAVILNIVGLNVGKWLQNAGGVATYLPLLMLVGFGAYLGFHRGSATAFSGANILPHVNWDTVNYWSQIAFAFTGMELVCAMSEEIREPRKTFPRAIYASAVLIALIYIAGTIAVLMIQPAAGTDTRTGVFQAISNGSATLGVAWFGVIAALLVTVGNAGGIGATVAGVARVPFVAGIDRYLPSYFGAIHPRWKTPYISILIQAGISGVILVLSQYKSSWQDQYQLLVDAAIILYFIPFLYMYASIIRLAYRADRQQENAVLVPGGKAGVWVAGSLGFAVTLISIVFAMVPPETENKWLFEGKLLGATFATIAIGLVLYWRGARKKATAS
jgi:glutamate:GABA antiporter